MRVYKFGGASVKDAAGIRNLALIVAKANTNLMVVVSAMGKTTNALERVVEARVSGNDLLLQAELQGIYDYHHQILVDLYADIYAEHISSLKTLYASLEQEAAKGVVMDYDAFYDTIVSYGELISTRLVSEYLCSQGIHNIWLDATKILLSDHTFREGKIDMEVSADQLRMVLSKNKSKCYLTQGFIAGTRDHKRVTLGREGSDYSAAIFAYLLNADAVTIWKDVPGILNADPRLREDTCLIPELTYYDAVELSYSGAQVIHPKTIRPLENKHIPLYVRPFGDLSAQGSVIKSETNSPINVPVYIWRKKQVLITIRAKDFSFVLEDSLSQIFDIVNRNRLKISLIQSSAVTISVCVDASRYVQQALQELSNDYVVAYNDGLSLLTIRGTTPEIIKKEKEGRDILLQQLTRRTMRMVVRE